MALVIYESHPRDSERIVGDTYEAGGNEFGGHRPRVARHTGAAVEIFRAFFALFRPESMQVFTAIYNKHRSTCAEECT